MKFIKVQRNGKDVALLNVENISTIKSYTYVQLADNGIATCTNIHFKNSGTFVLNGDRITELATLLSNDESVITIVDDTE